MRFRSIAAAIKLAWIAAGTVGIGICCFGCGRSKPAARAPIVPVRPVVDLEAVRPEVEQFCGGCHAVPRPESFPKDRWPHEVERGYAFFFESGRADLTPPRRSDVVEYFRSQAPDRLVIPAAPAVGDSTRFNQAKLAWPAASPAGIAVSHILSLGPGTSGAELAVCDMRSGAVSWMLAGEDRVVAGPTVAVPHAAHISRTDLDADGTADFLVADLGSFLPEDHDRGRLVWLRRADTQSSGSESAGWEEIVLLDHVGRVADAQPADFDGDGDLDIVVAVFGWLTTGDVLLLRRDGEREGKPQFQVEVIDERNGAIHVPVTDLNGDGKLDFVVLLSQEHESVEAFINRGDGTFDKQVLYRAPDPSYGSSGISLVDLDGDADLDVLYTNGDTFDSPFLKPYHSVRWIENRSGSWQDHLLANLPSVHRALAADFDGDGDMDVAACCFCPPHVLARQENLGAISSLVWLEQHDRQFVRHEIERDNCVHATMELADVNQDGAMDIIAGGFAHSAESSVLPVSVWLNRGRP